MKIKAVVFASTLVLLGGYAQLGFSAGKDPESPVIGTPAEGSKFSKIKVGMYSKEISDLIGPPTDTKTYATGKAWIPFHFGGADNYRTEWMYKGEGTLTFSSGGVSNTSDKLIRITVNTQESGYNR